MPDDELDDIENGDDNHNIRLLRQQAKEGKKAQERANELERELAFTRAGIPETPLAKYFVKGYDGEMTPEAIRVAAQEAGLVEAPPVTTATADEVDAHQRMQAASAGAALPSPSADLEQRLAAATDPFEIHRIMVENAGWTPLDKS